VRALHTTAPVNRACKVGQNVQQWPQGSAIIRLRPVCSCTIVSHG